MSKDKQMHDEECDCCEEDVNIVDLVDDEGKVHKCYHIGTIEYKNGWYAFFQPADEEEDDEDSVTILQIVGEEGEEELVPVEDDKLLDEVFEEFAVSWKRTRTRTRRQVSTPNSKRAAAAVAYITTTSIPRKTNKFTFRLLRGARLRFCAAFL